ncbi:hypothetical protein OQZ33_23040 [Pedobacter sp. MC2016-05]|uniref:hypothetical protein n=1 Tax=Pedobacter sp. MC2016-05 TaxID=2994474 RepID=UPI0022468FCC|nr:hypothetical protein [Pedobacter sp. MC2016-05]MCX2477228.1 hypothetical protein [Pedobacter sp. MC2016-05]
MIVAAYPGNGYFRMYTGYDQATGKYSGGWSDWASSATAAVNRANGDSMMYPCVNWEGGYSTNDTCTVVTDRFGEKSGTLSMFTGTLSSECSVPLDEHVYILLFILGAISFFYLKGGNLKSNQSNTGNC